MAKSGVKEASPSPSGDVYFEDKENLAEIEKRASDYKNGDSKATAVLTSAEDIKDFIQNF